MSSKRSASVSPSDHIKNKRRLSSPEEGEVDNEDDLQNGATRGVYRGIDIEEGERLPSESPDKGSSTGRTSKGQPSFNRKPDFLPARPSTPEELRTPTSAQTKSKIPFPFKTKDRQADAENGLNTYRPGMDDRRGYERGREGEYDSWSRGRYKEYPAHERRGNIYETPSSHRDRDSHYSPQRRPYHDRDRSATPPRDRSPSRSRSRDSFSRERHRLPPRPPVPPVDYQRRFDDYDYRSTYDYRPSHYSDRERSYDSYYPRDHRDRSLGDSYRPPDRYRLRTPDRSYRPQSPSRSTTETSKHQNPPTRALQDSYIPVSPYRPRSPSLRPPSPSPRDHERRTKSPAQPRTPKGYPNSGSPPPPPPSNKLPNHKDPVSIALPTKPSFPAKPSLAAAFSPLSTSKPTSSQPQQAPTSLPTKERGKEKPRKSKLTDEQRKALLPPALPSIIVPPPREAHGKIFTGTGLISDYSLSSKLGEGTFGEVHRATHISTGAEVALKRIFMHNEKEGFPVTAVREIKILKALDHPNIVKLREMLVVRGNSEKDPTKIYMVFPYMDHDLAGLLENDKVKFTPSQIKLYMKQLMEGTEYLHRNQILHRDMKAANLLIDNSGSLQIADFGLSRPYSGRDLTEGDPVFPPPPDRKERPFIGRMDRYTNCVVTRWYRPPELLMGARVYGAEVDMWGVGCILGEMYHRRPILQGTSDLDQLDRIWRLCGTPTDSSWPDWEQLPGCEGVKKFVVRERTLRETFTERLGEEGVDLLDRLLTIDPRRRMSATQALDHDYFWSDPLPADPKTLPVYESSHEFDRVKQKEAARRAAAPAHPPPTQGVPNAGYQYIQAPGTGRGYPHHQYLHPQDWRQPPTKPRRGGYTGPPPPLGARPPPHAPQAYGNGGPRGGGGGRPPGIPPPLGQPPPDGPVHGYGHHKIPAPLGTRGPPQGPGRGLPIRPGPGPHYHPDRSSGPPAGGLNYG